MKAWDINTVNVPEKMQIKLCVKKLEFAIIETLDFSEMWWTLATNT